MIRKFMQIVEGVTFTNELGNEIEITVEPREIDGVDGVWIDMIGPTSEHENHITRQEAEVVYAELGKLLDDDEDEE